VTAVIVMKNGDSSPPPAQPTTQTADGLPRLIELGSVNCIPCKMMAPILENLKKEYVGRMQVDFIDVNANPDAARPFNITFIPTQVFLDKDGKEVFRHVGFFPQEEIEKQMAKMGVK